MSRRSPTPLLLLLAAALATGAAAPSLRADDDADGKRLYRAKCSGCHRLHPKEELTEEQWRTRLPEMARRAKLTPEQRATIARYLGVTDGEPAAAQASPTPTPAPSHAASAPARR